MPVLKQKSSESDVHPRTDEPASPTGTRADSEKATEVHTDGGHRHRIPHHDKVKGRNKKAIRRTVLLRTPPRDGSGPWVKPEHEATEWLSLFYGEPLGSVAFSVRRHD